MVNKVRMTVWLDEKIAKEIEKILGNENFKIIKLFIIEVEEIDLNKLI